MTSKRKTLRDAWPLALCVLVVLCFLAAPAVVAQAPPAHGPMLQTPTSETSQGKEPAPGATAAKPISLLAFVEDKKGQPVSSVTQQDLVLEQDGHAQTITQLTDQGSQPLTIGLVAETTAEQRKGLGQERKAGAEFFKQLREGTDRGFVLHFDRQVELLQDITTSHDKLAKGVDEISVDNAPRKGRKREESHPGQEHFTFGGTVLYDAIFLSVDEVLKSEGGRKAMVVFSDGVDQSSKMSMRQAIDAAQRVGVVVYCVYVAPEREYESPNQSGPGGSPGSYPGSYPPGYPGGRYPPLPGGYPGGYPGGAPMPPRREPQESPHANKELAKKSLQQIAQDTGGRFFELSKMNAARIFAQIASEMHHQYTLTYTPDPATSGYHRLHVSARNPDLTVRTPSGLYAE